MGSKTDVIDEVVKDHEEIKALFARVESATGDAKQEAFEELVRRLAVHETAEQEVVHPLLRQAGREDIRDERISEEKEAEVVLADLLKMGTEDAAFDTAFESLKTDVLHHAEMEEQTEHPKIRQEMDAGKLEKLAPAFRAAEAIGPTRPHPMGPTSAAGNLAIGPVVAIMDRARDAVRSAMDKLSA